MDATNAEWREWAKALPSYLGHKAKPAFSPEIDAEVIEAIRANHLKANIDDAERDSESSIIFWDEAWVDPGGTIFGDGPYLKVPVISRLFSDEDKLPRRVYAPARLQRRLARMVAARKNGQKGGWPKGKKRVSRRVISTGFTTRQSADRHAKTIEATERWSDVKVERLRGSEYMITGVFR